MSLDQRQGQWSGISKADYLKEERVRTITKMVTGFRVEKFLDIGCGTGELSLIVGSALLAKSITGIDIGSQAVAEATKKGIDAYVLDLDSSNLPFEDGRFEFILCGEVIEHLYDTDHLLSEIHRVLAPAGRCIITTPNLASWVNRLILIFGYQPFGTSPSIKYGFAGMPFYQPAGGEGQHLRVLTLRALRVLVQRHGFKVVKTAGAKQLGYSIPRPIKPIYSPLSRIAQRVPSLADDLIIMLQT